MMVFFALYLGTAQRTVGWQDSGMFQWRVLKGDYAGKLGLALAHPLYIAAGRLLAAISRRHLPLLLNAFSGLGMAVALANLAAVTALLTGKRWVGLLTAAMLAVTHTVWWLGTIAEVYTWSAAGLTAEIWLLVLLIRRPRWELLGCLALVSGLGLCVHNFALLPLPVYVVVAAALTVRRKLPPWSLAAAAAGYILGAGLYLGLIVDLWVRSGDLLGAIRSGLFGDYSEQVLNVAAGSRHWKSNAALSGLNFANVLLPLVVIGWFRMRRRLGAATAAAIGAVTLIEMLFFIRYPVPDQFTFILPTLMVVGVAAALGLATLCDLSRRWRTMAITACIVSLIWQPAFYAAAPALAKRFVGEVRRARELPFRDEGRYWLTPWKHNERSAQLFAAAALLEAAPNGVIVPDSTSAPPLRMVRELTGLWEGVSVQFEGGPLTPYARDPDAFRAELADRPFFATTDVQGYIPKKLREDANFHSSPGAVLYTVRWKQP
jgi:hypothetical protein